MAWAGKLPVVIVDADIGQSTVGPPAAIGLATVKENVTPEFRIDSLPCRGGSSSGRSRRPVIFSKILVGTKRLVDTSVRSGVGTVLVDTTGLIDQGPGFQLKLRKIELLGPRHLVAISRRRELEPLLAVVGGRQGLRIHWLEVSPSARARAPAERARYRLERFAAYFAGAHSHVLETEQLIILAPPGGRFQAKTGITTPVLQPGMLWRADPNGLVVGPDNSANETIGLGVLEEVSQDGHRVSIRTPLVEPGVSGLSSWGASTLLQMPRRNDGGLCKVCRNERKLPSLSQEVENGLLSIAVSQCAVIAELPDIGETCLNEACCVRYRSCWHRPLSA